MKAKAGVNFIHPHPGVLFAMDVIDTYWRRAFGRQAYVTSGRDGTHSEGSLHYGIEGDARERALDVRTRDLDASEQSRALEDLRRLLGASYDVILEATHLHVEVEAKKWGPLG